MKKIVKVIYSGLFLMILVNCFVTKYVLDNNENYECNELCSYIIEPRFIDEQNGRS